MKIRSTTCSAFPWMRILQIEPYVSSVDRVVASVPDVVDKIAGLFNKDKKDKENEDISLPPQY